MFPGTSFALGLWIRQLASEHFWPGRYCRYKKIAFSQLSWTYRPELFVFPSSFLSSPNKHLNKEVRNLTFRVFERLNPTFFPETEMLLVLPGHDDVGVLHGGWDVSVVGWLHVVLVLLHHAVDVAAALADVALQAPRQAHVRVCLHKHLRALGIKLFRQLKETPPLFLPAVSVFKVSCWGMPEMGLEKFWSKF